MKKKNKNKMTDKPNKRILALLMALGAQTMIMELSMPRILAPTFGNTLFCWTAIITVVLAALALGYYWGGRLALRKNVPKMVIAFSALSALWVLSLGVWGQRLTPSFYHMGIEFGPLMVSLLLATVPATLSAAVLPMVVELRGIRAGLAAGESYAWSTVGSVTGVLFTGYFLLPVFGIKGSMMIAAIIVFAALALQGKIMISTGGLSLAVLVYFMPVPGYAGAIFDKSNGYHRIVVVERSNEQNIRDLYVDTSLDGSVNMDSSFPVLSYQQMITDIVGQISDPQSVFIMGGGAFSLPVYLKEIYPDMRIDVAEIDPDIVYAAKTHLGLAQPDFNILIGDGRYLLHEQTEKYDLIINDAFKGLKEIPFHLATREFYELVKKKLSPEGLYAINVIGQPSESRMTRSLISTLAQDFEYISLKRNVSGCIHNVWILASQRPFQYGYKPLETEMNSLILTDDRSPVAYLIARDFMDQNWFGN